LLAIFPAADLAKHLHLLGMGVEEAQATRTRGRPAWRARLGYTRARLHVVSSLFSLAIADS